MAIMYTVICVFDFILFPILWALVQLWGHSAISEAFKQWSPLTLQNGGLFHMAMGAVLGVSAWTRGQEKIAGISYTRSSDYQQNMQTNRDYQQPQDNTPAVKPIIRRPV